MKTAVYLRVSSDEQAERGHGIGFQREDCQKRARELGATSVTEYADEGVSGSVLERPALETLRADLRAGRLDLVVVWDPDRLSRKLTHQLILTEEIERHAKLVFVKFEWQNTPEGQLFYQLRGAVAQFEREKIRERTMAGRRQKARQGKLPFAMAPYGYRYDQDNATLVVVPGEAAVVQRIFKELIELKAGLNGIAKRLTADGIPTRKGGLWHRQVIKQIIVNSAYMGVYYANRRDMAGVGLNKYRKTGKTWGTTREREEWIPVEVPAIVDPQDWERAQKLLQNIKHLWRGSEKADYLLSGLLRCTECQQTMSGVLSSTWGKKVRYYTCRKNWAGARNPGCPHRNVKADTLEERVGSVVMGWLQDPESLLAELNARNGDQTNWSEELARMEEKLKQVQARQRNILLVLEKGLADTDDALDSLNRLKQQENSLREQLSSLQKQRTDAAPDPQATQDLVKTLNGYLETLQHATAANIRRDILRQLVVGIEVGLESLIIRAKIPAFPARGSHAQGDLDAPQVPEAHPGGSLPVRPHWCRSGGQRDYPG